MNIKNGMTEVHPWNLFTANFDPYGTYPDKNWIKFMVDSLNEKAEDCGDTLICGLENSKR